VLLRETFLGLGSNIGDREHNLIRAVKLLSGICSILDYSSLYNSAPVGYTDQADFLNMVVKVNAARFGPEELLKGVKDIEHSMGREKTFRWGPRIIDIDILYAKNVQFSSERLNIPHKELINRLFVLVPLAEITDSLTLEGTDIPVEDRIRELRMKNDTEIGEKVTLFKSRQALELHE
jgi:2-amino-4-hydroxy-6-hydroxymethyldihydropteridine diphosphokinase